mmetsp:Transcript_25541/g.52324  ORF Transcript_25541/g.52324 Transcript_25541/m.52324 type:complete len:496 (-) Transcript_25541:190-1677(-)
MTTTVDTSKLETRLFINNEFVNSVAGKTFETVNPATEEVVCSVQEAGPEDVDKAVAAAKAAFEVGSPWRNLNGSDRRDLMLKLANLVERDRAFLEVLEAMDNGKPIGTDGRYGTSVDLHLVIQYLRYAAGHADKVLGSQIPVDGHIFAYTRKEPVGVCGAIIPWNFPLLMFAWKVGPILATGCTVVFKTSEKTPLSALHIGKLIKEAGFPPGVVNILSGYGSAGEALARHMDVDKIAFTGSTAVGHKIEQYATESNMKKVTLELGGKSPMIILDDANLETAVNTARAGLFLNQGQVCTASSRIFVHESIHDKFVAAMVQNAQGINVGGYDEKDIDQGPQVDKIQFLKVLGYIEKGIEEGATLRLGGHRHGNKGYFIEPTIFTDVKDDMVIAKEEIFGPVMSIFKFKTDEEAITRANATKYGLAASVVSENGARAISTAHQLRAGTVWINTHNSFDAAVPFGGYKESGHGRELGFEAMENYLETKTVMLPLTGPKV